MAKFLASLLLVLSFPTFVQASKDDDFERFDQLSREFPKVFGNIIERRFIVPTKMPLLMEEPGVSTIAIPPRLSWLSKSAPVKPVINSWFRRPNETHLVISNTRLPPEMPPEYGWKVLLAELLIQYPHTQKIDISEGPLDGALYAGLCADRLAQGESEMTALEAVPFHKALLAFGFELTSTKLEYEAGLAGETNALERLHMNASYSKPISP